MIDRFGPLPDEVDHLLKIVFIKGLCRTANIEKLDAGPKGLVVQFRNREFSNPAGIAEMDLRAIVPCQGACRPKPVFVTGLGELLKSGSRERLSLRPSWPRWQQRRTRATGGYRIRVNCL